MTELHWREQQVLEGLAKGLTARAIGTTLGLGRTTVITYLVNLYRSLDALNAAHAVTLGFAKGFLRVEDFA